MTDDDQPFKPGGVIPPPVTLDSITGAPVEFVRPAYARELVAGIAAAIVVKQAVAITRQAAYDAELTAHPDLVSMDAWLDAYYGDPA